MDHELKMNCEWMCNHFEIIIAELLLFCWGLKNNGWTFKEIICFIYENEMP